MRRIQIVVVLILMSTTSLHAAGLKVGHFDLQRLIAQSDAGKDAREKYLSQAKNYQDEINTRTKKLQKMKEEIEAVTKGLKSNEKPSAPLVQNEKETQLATR